jgi:transposase InsO family protein
VKQHAGKYPVEKMCKALKVSRSRYYAWCKSPESARELENRRVSKLVKKAFEDSFGIYGSPRVTIELKKLGHVVSRPFVARIMHRDGLRSMITPRFVNTTDSKHGHNVSPNLLERDFKPGKPGRAWVSDITYIPTYQGWLYLTTIIDLGDRSVVGWAMSSSMHAQVTVMAAWRMAMINRGTAKGMIFHSDRGVQYACKEFRELLLSSGDVSQSMSRKGDCWDNAVAESFFKSLKSEWLNHKKFKTRAEAENEVFSYIEIWYNRKRLHSALGYLSPEQYALKIAS